MNTALVLAMSFFCASRAFPQDSPVVDSTALHQSRVITEVDVVPGDVVPPWWEEAVHTRRRLSRWTYAMLNALHIKTKPHVVERELLFAVGDTLRQKSLDESERNLRAYSFINEAAIEAYPADSNGVRVLVRTSDNFSLAAGWISESGGGSDRIGALVTEKNLLGFGKEIAAQYERERNRSRGTTETEWLFQYKDPRLIGSRFALQVSASRAYLGNEFMTALARPFTTTRTRNAGGVEFYHFTGRMRLWRDKVPVAELPVTTTDTYAWVAHAWGEASKRTKLQAALRLRNTRHTDTPLLFATWLPRDTIRVSRVAYEPSFTISRQWTSAFHKLRNLDDYDTVEDVESGTNIGLTTGFGLPSQPTHNPYGLAGAFAEWCVVRGEHVTAARLQVSTRLADDQGSGRSAWSNREVAAYLHHYYTGLPWQTFALNVNWRSGERMDGPYQLVLGGDRGLRGYSANVFEGNRRIVLNAEDRIFSPVRVLVYRLGFVVFADAGYVWQPDRRVDPRDIRANIGAGFRVYNNRAATGRVSRLDIAWNVRGQRGFMISGGSEQLFDLFNRRPTPTR